MTVLHGNSETHHELSGFTLIELLIVIAIITILVAVAVPNFLEAQTRARVARCRSDFRTLAASIESYAVDYGKIPLDEGNQHEGDYSMWCQLTTPVAYLSSVLANPFPSTNLPFNPLLPVDFYSYINTSFFSASPAQLDQIRESKITWMISSAGPNLLTDFIGFDFPAFGDIARGASNYLYDPTNGTITSGDLICTNVRPY